MQKNSASKSGLFNPRVLLTFAFCSAGGLLGLLSFAANPPAAMTGPAAKSAGDSLAGNKSPRQLSTHAVAALASLPLAPTGPGWSLVKSPDLSANLNNLYGVACASASECWAVGHYITDIYQTLIEHWDGTLWSIVTSPNTSATQSNFLNGVTCTSASQCWAVGDYIDGSGFDQTLIEQWNGTSWSIFASPNFNLPMSNNFLNGVTCASASQCWAVGYINGVSFQTLIDQWNGTSWAIVSPSNINAPESILQGVTCGSTSECWAVGYSVAPMGTVDQTLIEQWNGTSWVIVPSPNTSATQNNFLNSVTCASASDCWAVGEYISSGGGFDQTLIEHWDGTLWSIVTSPNTSATQSNFLNGVTCTSASQCWAVGDYVDGSGFDQTLIEQWNGASWLIVASPNASAQDNFLNAVTCASASECWAVGNYLDDSGFEHTLIEEYAPTSPPLTGVASRMVHSSAGTFDIDLPLTGNPGIECRSGGANGDYTLVFTFANTLTSVAGATVTSGTGSVSSSAIDSNDAHNYIVNLTGVANAQYITVSITNVTDSVGDFSPAVAEQMGVLIGDVNATGLVDSGDVFLVRQQTGQAVISSNFREDVNASGLIDSGDVFLTRQETGTSLP